MMTILQAVLGALGALWLVWAVGLSRLRPPCPRCGAPAVKTLWSGLNFYLCPDEACGTGWGFGAWVSDRLGAWDGWHMTYDGSYLGALIWRLFNTPEYHE